MLKIIWIYNNKLNKRQGVYRVWGPILGRPLLANEQMALVLRFLAGRWRIAEWLTNLLLRI
jgi:hypothetical protein